MRKRAALTMLQARSRMAAMSVAGGALTGRSRTHLREPASSFVGRRQELGEIRETLARSRIVTLTGPGGAGKTRLVLRPACFDPSRTASGWPSWGI
jgi:hypothetical protein